MITNAGLYSSKDAAISLLSVNIDVELVDAASKVKITQHFKNMETCNIEAVYCFPIEESATICSMNIENSGRRIKSSVKEKESAFEAYDNAVETGNNAALLDMHEKDILTISLGNLLPGEELKAEVEYISELSVSDGIIRLQIPTSVAPRYIPHGANAIKSDIISPPYSMETPYKLYLRVSSPCRMIKKISSPSHDLEIVYNNPGFEAKLSRGHAELDRDFILEIESKEPEKPKCFVSRHENGKEACMISFQPFFQSEINFQESEKSEIFFMIDCSSSMACSSINNAKSALELCLRSMKAGDAFNIIKFGTEYEIFSRKRSIEYNEENLAQALDELDSIEADMGGTELFEALSAMSKIPVRKGYARNVILISDGEIYNTLETIRFVSKECKNMRFYTFGVGYGASHHLIKGLARASRGAWEIIQPGENIQKKVLRQFSRLEQPAVKNLKVETENCNLRLSENLPPVYEGDGLILFAETNEGILQTGQTIYIKGRVGEENFTWQCEVENIGQNNIIPCLMAANEIRNLEENPYITENANDLDKIQKLGMDFNLLSMRTSFVAVTERNETEKPENTPEFRRIPVMITKDYTEELSSAIPAFSLKDGTSEKQQECPDYFKVLKTESYRIRESENYYSSAEEWYLELLKTQTAEGYFEGIMPMAGKLGTTPDKLSNRIKKLLQKNQGNEEQIALTQIAIMLLETEDKEVRLICSRAIKKAKKWLESMKSGIQIKLEDLI
jgi:Ca-activated chloride channel family protein